MICEICNALIPAFLTTARSTRSIREDELVLRTCRHMNGRKKAEVHAIRSSELQVDFAEIELIGRPGDVIVSDV